MKIRPAKENDLDACERLLDDKAFQLADGSFPSKALLKMHLDPDYFLVAEAQGAISGCIVGEPLRGNIVMIWYLSVQKESRNSGVGSLLLRTLEANAKKHNQTHVGLCLSSTHAKAKSFYQKHGFSFGQVLQECRKKL